MGGDALTRESCGQVELGNLNDRQSSLSCFLSSVGSKHRKKQHDPGNYRKAKLTGTRGMEKSEPPSANANIGLQCLTYHPLA
jgi:hypothetical protein